MSRDGKELFRLQRNKKVGVYDVCFYQIMKMAIK